MYDLLNEIFNSKACEQQDELMQLQADYVTGRFCTKNNQLDQRKVIVSWLNDKGCDISMDGQHHYQLNGERFEWLNVNPIKEWLKNELR